MFRVTCVVLAIAAMGPVTAGAGSLSAQGFDADKAVPGWELPGRSSLEPDSPSRITDLERRHCRELTKAANGAMLRRQRGQSIDDAREDMLGLIGPTSVEPADLDALLKSAYGERRPSAAQAKRVAVYRFRMQVLYRCRDRAMRS